MISPLNKILDWYNSLPAEHRTDISALTMNSCPGFAITSDPLISENLENNFINTLETYKSGNMKEIGMCLALKSCIEFLIISKRSTKEDWSHTKAIMKTLEQQTNSSSIQKQNQSIEFRGQQWISTCQKWNEMKSKYLTAEYLEDYLNES